MKEYLNFKIAALNPYYIALSNFHLLYSPQTFFLKFSFKDTVVMAYYNA